ncbi:MAG: glutaredoxin [Deltaproteobacteria bacterium]|nr:MAG: glutaredoxin [Deltaproteobacteria bacterium]
MRETTSEPRVRLYTTPWCPYCLNAKRLLERDGIAFVDHDVSVRPELRREIANATRWRTVPMIFVDDQFIGGYTELAAFRERGGLTQLGLTA